MCACVSVLVCVFLWVVVRCVLLVCASVSVCLVCFSVCAKWLYGSSCARSHVSSRVRPFVKAVFAHVVVGVCRVCCVEAQVIFFSTFVFVMFVLSFCFVIFLVFEKMGFGTFRDYSFFHDCFCEVFRFLGGFLFPSLFLIFVSWMHWAPQRRRKTGSETIEFVNLWIFEILNFLREINFKSSCRP